jgi:hypothetical protein
MNNLKKNYIMAERATSINQLPGNKETEDSGNIVQDIINQMDSDNIQQNNEQQNEQEAYQNQQFNKQPIPIPQEQQYYDEQYEQQYVEEPQGIQDMLKEPLLVALIVFIMINPKVMTMVMGLLSKYKFFENEYLVYAVVALVSGVVFFGVKKYVL